MNLHDMKLVTIVCEALASQLVTKIVDEVGAHGYTIFPVQGLGAKGPRRGEMEEFSNVQVEVILPTEGSHALLEKLEAELFSNYSIIAYESDARVLRREKF